MCNDWTNNHINIISTTVFSQAFAKLNPLLVLSALANLLTFQVKCLT